MPPISKGLEVEVQVFRPPSCHFRQQFLVPCLRFVTAATLDSVAEALPGLWPSICPTAYAHHGEAPPTSHHKPHKPRTPRTPTNTPHPSARQATSHEATTPTPRSTTDTPHRSQHHEKHEAPRQDADNISSTPHSCRHPPDIWATPYDQHEAPQATTDTTNQESTPHPSAAPRQHQEPTQPTPRSSTSHNQHREAQPTPRTDPDTMRSTKHPRHPPDNISNRHRNPDNISSTPAPRTPYLYI